MKGHCNALRCNYCGRFISFSKPRWNYTPFDVNAVEPPDDINICEKCFSALTPEDIARIKSIAWQPLIKIEVK